MTDRHDRPRHVAVVAADLLFASRIRAAAEQLGVRATFARNADQLAEAAATADLVILDLDTRWLDAPVAIRDLKRGAARHPPVIAFVSHVRTDAIDAAREAGADSVLARSAFVRSLAEILTGA